MKFFGTDGIRRKAEEFTTEFLTAIVCGLVDYAGTSIKVLLAGDTRESSEWILRDLETALESLGVEYGNAGVLPTPAINYCFYAMGFDFAIDVTASHNPFLDNGIKIFERGEYAGQKLGTRGCEIIEVAISTGKTVPLAATSIREDLHEEAVARYVEHLLEYVGEVDFSGLRVAVDCANGATSVIGGTVFERLGAEVFVINADAEYGRGINAECGSTHLENLRGVVLERGLDFGVAFDGDGDRCLLIDASGEIVDGDQIIVILAKALGLDAAAVTVMANQGLLDWAEKNKIRLEITAVGDSNVAAAMREFKIPIGGEQSGHIILPGEATGDGMLTALMVLKAAVLAGKTLEELASEMTKFPQVIVNMEANAEQKATLKTSEAAKKLLLSYDEKLKAVSGRLLVRPSGTENLIRITMWGNEEVAISRLAEELKAELVAIL